LRVALYFLAMLDIGKNLIIKNSDFQSIIRRNRVSLPKNLNLSRLIQVRNPVSIAICVSSIYDFPMHVVTKYPKSL